MPAIVIVLNHLIVFHDPDPPPHFLVFVEAIQACWSYADHFVCKKGRLCPITPCLFVNAIHASCSRRFYAFHNCSSLFNIRFHMFNLFIVSIISIIFIRFHHFQFYHSFIIFHDVSSYFVHILH